MKKIAALLLILNIFLMLSAGTYRNASAEGLTNAVNSEEIMQQIQKEEAANEAYEEIHNKLGIVDPSNPLFPNYPKIYGGAYYKDEALHILLTDNTPEAQMEYLQLVNNPAVIIFESADFSYNELYLGMLQTAKEIEPLFSSIGVDVINQTICIGISIPPDSDEWDQLTQAMLNDATTLLPINFVYEQRSSPSTTEIRGGMEISWPESGETHYGSIAICGTRQGSNAILTAGHCTFVGTTYKLGSPTLGTGSLKQYATDQFYDYGIITYTGGSSFTMSNKVKNNSSYTTITSTLSSSSGLVGTHVCKYGAKTNFSTGEIALINSLVNYADGTLLYGMSKVIDYDCDGSYTIGAKGDSGGPVYVGHKLYGIYSGDGSEVNSSGVITTNSDYFWYSPIYGVAGFTVKTS